MYPQYICFEQNYEHSLKISTEYCHFYSREILQYIARTCLRNALVRGIICIDGFLYTEQEH